MRRAAIFLFFDPQGKVDDYVPYALERLRPHVEHILVVANEPLTESGRVTLASVSDEVLVRKNSGYDVGAYKEAIKHIGLEKLGSYDEIILLNYTFFGPFGSFDDLFEKMDAKEVDFWGLTDHGEVRPNPSRNAPDPSVLPRHIQSTWIGIRQRMVQSKVFAQYWREMPKIESYDDSVQHHEARFTQFFERRGFSSAVAYPESNYDSKNPALDHADLLLLDGCPIVKRRVFFMDPVHMEEEAILGRRTLEILERSGYPMELIWKNLVRATEARTLITNLSLIEVLDDHENEIADPPRVAVVAHLFYVDVVQEVMSRLDHIPVPYDLFVTTSDKAKASAIRELIGDKVPGTVDVRVVESNAGRDISAFLVACKDVLEPGRYDLVCKIHSKRSPQDGYNRAMAFKDYLFDNLLHSRGYVSQILGLFERHPSLGALFPPVVSLGYPTLGHGWFTNKPGAERLIKKLGLEVPLDEHTPVAPLGSMFWARPEALRPLTDPGFTWEDFRGDGHYGDGSLPHVLERTLGYAVLGSGYHVREVFSTWWAGVSFGFTEYKLQRISAELPAQTREQLDYIDVVIGAADNPIVWLRRRMGLRHPRLAHRIKPVYQLARHAYRKVRPLITRSESADRTPEAPVIESGDTGDPESTAR